MPGQFRLTTIYPKQRAAGQGSLSVDKHGEAMLFEGQGDSGSRIMGTMQRVRIVQAAAHGILLSGMEPCVSGGKFIYQEWWLSYQAADPAGHFRLTTVHPTQREAGQGSLALDKHGEAMIFEGQGESGSRILGTMQRVRIEQAAAHGILLSGMAPSGSGSKFVYQEWWLAYQGTDAAPAPARTAVTPQP